AFEIQAPPNAAPTAKNDTASTKPSTPVTVNVLSNDTDPDGDSLTVTSITSGPSHGTASIVTVSGKKQIKYAPNTTFHGTAKITRSAFVFGEGGADIIHSGGGNDVIVGGNGNDQLFGGSGRDILIGSGDADALSGEAGDDLLVAGTTIYDGSLSSLNKLLKAW